MGLLSSDTCEMIVQCVCQPAPVAPGAGMSDHFMLGRQIRGSQCGVSSCRSRPLRLLLVACACGQERPAGETGNRSTLNATRTVLARTLVLPAELMPQALQRLDVRPGDRWTTGRGTVLHRHTGMIGIIDYRVRPHRIAKDIFHP